MGALGLYLVAMMALFGIGLLLYRPPKPKKPDKVYRIEEYDS